MLFTKFGSSYFVSIKFLLISEFLMKIPFVDDFEIETKAGVKCSEKAVRYRERGSWQQKREIQNEKERNTKGHLEKYKMTNTGTERKATSCFRRTSAPR